MSAQCNTRPLLWQVKHRQLGAVDTILLGDTPDDRYRISVTLVDDKDVDARAVYPCRACGWEFSCGPNGEDCHS